MDQYPPIRSSRKVEDKSRQSHDSDHNIPAPSSSDNSQGSSGLIRRNIYGDPIE
ncbi:Hypothetical predicted protein [Paramuricea clavata]|uniref:Uncharacterized protein n=1 Tax=Paramuricea clavata TaxID=317549 RepID=A0A6S7HY25_PARCT|nr:Hypothetical predicted protein [Paramuricea clavata]